MVYAFMDHDEVIHLVDSAYNNRFQPGAKTRFTYCVKRGNPMYGIRAADPNRMPTCIRCIAESLAKMAARWA